MKKEQRTASINCLCQVIEKGNKMKKIAFGTACGILAVFIFVVMLTLYGRSARQQEAAMALSQAIDSRSEERRVGKECRRRGV